MAAPSPASGRPCHVAAASRHCISRRTAPPPSPSRAGGAGLAESDSPNRQSGAGVRRRAGRCGGAGVAERGAAAAAAQVGPGRRWPRGCPRGPAVSPGPAGPPGPSGDGLAGRAGSGEGREGGGARSAGLRRERGGRGACLPAPPRLAAPPPRPRLSLGTAERVASGKRPRSAREPPLRRVRVRVLAAASASPPLVV